MTERLTPRSGVKALIVERGHVLMNRMVMPDGSVMYEAPGGGQDHGETLDQALRRECREEIGIDVTVYAVACVWEFLTTMDPRDHSRPIPPFHQVNVAMWCGIEPGAQPGMGSNPDLHQDGCQWLPIDELHTFDVRPVSLARWLQSDPSDRPVWIQPS